MKFFINTDGASRGNPGKASYGFVIRDEQDRVVKQRGEYIGINTNNIAEYTAIIEAIRDVKALSAQPQEIELYFLMDSLLAVEQLSGRYRVKNANIKLIYDQIKREISAFKIVSFKHIPRALNKDADRMANLALDSL